MESQNPFLQTNAPTIQEVKIYFDQKGLPEYEAESFFLFYKKRGWKSKTGNYFKNWKSIAYYWIQKVFHSKPWLFNRNVR